MGSIMVLTWGKSEYDGAAGARATMWILVFNPPRERPGLGALSWTWSRPRTSGSMVVGVSKTWSYRPEPWDPLHLAVGYFDGTAVFPSTSDKGRPCNFRVNTPWSPDPVRLPGRFVGSFLLVADHLPEVGGHSFGAHGR